jgi:hypothetical protein
MKYLMLILIATTACSKQPANQNQNQKYEIVCKHPLGHVERYPVTFNTFWSPHANAAGIFRFETTDGRFVVSGFCHGEAVQ